MELSLKSYNNLKDYIDKSFKNKNYELELRFNNYKLNYADFQKIFQKFTFSKSNNGLGYKYEMINELDIVLNTNKRKKKIIAMIDLCTYVNYLKLCKIMQIYKLT